MAKDFTIKVYKQLLKGLITNGYCFQTYRGFTEHPEEKVILLRRLGEGVRTCQSLRRAAFHFKVIVYSSERSPDAGRSLDSMRKNTAFRSR